MQVNMLEAKNQLSRLVKAAQAGEEVIIANHGVPAVRLVAVEEQQRRTGGWASLNTDAQNLDEAFSPELDAEIAALFLDGE
ncbi:MAG: type II toxin-antitoxin system prevent-host-death family antitoxin [Pseudomonadota bacterium]|nr:type II toxin-antitoxin system prevent-host-death family antitoxin [Pseudomonadota bacterium]MDP1904117.1 type II toxin-antitoxin system prevent-host-death family antitoxin [Pseudomonadota bacterium]MDP2351190.1 type II toxin-antitoxin system prevent-host-death family antitoxin [Pseudomonadota bacterium]